MLLPAPVPGLVLRTEVIDRISDPTVRVAVVAAPAGYGKTSQVAAAVRADHRPTAWMDIEPRHDEAGILLRELVAVLREVGGLDASSVPTGAVGLDPRITGVAAALGRAVRRCSEPFVLVLDDAHHIASPPAMDLLEVVAANVPSGSLVVIVGRTFGPEALARIRAEEWVVTVDEADLSLDVPEVGALLAALGLDVSDAQVSEVATSTEGWPVGVRLAAKAALAHQAGGSPPEFVPSGQDPLVSAYLNSEWIGGADASDRDFLRQASVLDSLSAPLCDAVFDRVDSGEILHRLHNDRHLLIPLGRRGDVFRMHGLLREALQAGLERVDRGAAMRANLRASEWFESHGDPDRAIHHAVAAEEWDRAARLVVDHTPLQYTNGHFATIQRWVASLPQDRVLRSPGLCVSAALAALGLGDIRAVRVWLSMGQAAVDAAPGAEPMAELGLLSLRATSNVGLARPARDDAEQAYLGHPPGIWHAGACLAYGAWSWMVGEDVAVQVIDEGIDEASVLGAAVLETLCSAVRSMMAQAEGDAVLSRHLAVRARSVAADNGLDPMPAMAIVSAQHALVAAAGGDADVARSDWQLARSQLALLRDLSGWANVLTRLALAHTSLLLGDRVGAETLLGEVRELLVRQPDAVLAREQLAKLEEMAGLLRRRDGSGASALTTAELRVLNYLPTNLTLAEVAERLYVSRYTIKTHCESIYRKLGVRSRSEAVASARSLGLLDGFSFPDDG